MHHDGHRFSNRGVLCCLFCIFTLLQIPACSRTVALKKGVADGFGWTMFGGTADHRNFTPESFEPPLFLSWKNELSAAPVLSAVSSGGVVLLSTNDGQTHLFDEKTGRKSGAMKRRAGQAASPLLVNNTLILAYESGGTTLYAYDISSGRELWSKKLGSIQASPVFSNGRIFIAALEGVVYSISPSSGAIDWEWKGEELLYASPAGRDTMIIIAGLDGTVTALNSVSGSVLWQSAGKRSFRGSPVIAGSAILIGSLEGKFVSLSLSDGKENWCFNAGNKIYSTPACDDDFVIFGSNDRKIYALRQKTGEAVWTFQTDGLVASAPVITGGYVYCGSMDYRLYALDKLSGEKIWSYNLEGQMTQSPVFTGSRIIVGTNRKLVFAFSKNK